MKWRTGLKKLSLNLLVIVSLTVAVWIGYQLFYLHKVPAVIGSILFIANGILLIWSIRLLRTVKYRTKAPGFRVTVASVLAVFVVLAFAGVEPVSAAKDKITNWVKNEASKITSATPNSDSVESSKEKIILRERFLAGLQLFPSVVELNKVQQWVYSSSQKLNFRSLNPPYVLNVGIRAQTSQIAAELEVRVYRKGDPYQLSDFPITTRTIAGMGGRQAFIIKEKGDYVIDVQSVGYQWWAMVGHETEGVRQ